MLTLTKTSMYYFIHTYNRVTRYIQTSPPLVTLYLIDPITNTRYKRSSTIKDQEGPRQFCPEHLTVFRCTAATHDFSSSSTDLNFRPKWWQIQVMPVGIGRDENWARKRVREREKKLPPIQRGFNLIPISLFWPQGVVNTLDQIWHTCTYFHSFFPRKGKGGALSQPLALLNSEPPFVIIVYHNFTKSFFHQFFYHFLS